MVSGVSGLPQAKSLNFQEIPLLFPAAAYLSGWMVCSLINIPSFWLWVTPLIMVGCLAGIAFCQKRTLLNTSFCLFMLFLGIFNTQTCKAKESMLIPHFSNEWKSVRGIILSEPQYSKQKQRLKWVFVLKHVCLENQSLTCSRLPGDIRVVLINPKLHPAFGQTIRLQGKLTNVSPPLNPGEFNYKEYLQRRNIYWQMMAIGPQSVTVKKTNRTIVSYLLRLLHHVRFCIGNTIQDLYSLKATPYIQALLIGMNTQISLQEKESFMKTGTAHLLAISGMNMTLIAGTCYALFLYLGLTQRASAFFGMILTFVYAFVGGCGVPLQRAGWMSGAIFLALCLQRKHFVLNILMAAFLFLAVAHPNSLNEISFQLSFLGVMGMVMASRGTLSWAEAPSLFTHSISLFLWTTPALIYHFQIFSLSSFFANLFAIPLFHLITLFAWFSIFLKPIPFGSDVFIKIAEGLLSLTLLGIKQLSNIPFSYFYLPKPDKLFLGIYYVTLGIGSFVSYQRKPWQRWAVLFILFSGFILVEAGMGWRNSQKVKIQFFSANNQDLAFISIKGKNWLINSGLNYPSKTAERILEPFLKSIGVTHLEGVIITSQDQKGWGGAETLHRNFRIKRWYIPPETTFHKRKGWKPKPGRVIRTNSFSLGNESSFYWMKTKNEQTDFLIILENKLYVFIRRPLSEEEQKKIEGFRGIPKNLYISQSFWQNAGVAAWREVIQVINPELIISSKFPLEWQNSFPRKRYDLAAQGALEVLEN